MKPIEGYLVPRNNLVATARWSHQVESRNDVLIIPRSLATDLEALLDSLPGEVVGDLLAELRSREP
jgi:hypothetical protein